MFSPPSPYFLTKEQWAQQMRAREKNWLGRAFSQPGPFYIPPQPMRNPHALDRAAGLVPMKPAPLGARKRQQQALDALREGEAVRRRDAALGRALVRAFGL